MTVAYPFILNVQGSGNSIVWVFLRSKGGGRGVSFILSVFLFFFLILCIIVPFDESLQYDGGGSCVADVIMVITSDVPLNSLVALFFGD